MKIRVLAQTVGVELNDPIRDLEYFGIALQPCLRSEVEVLGTVLGAGYLFNLHFGTTILSLTHCEIADKTVRVFVGNACAQERFYPSITSPIRMTIPSKESLEQFHDPIDGMRSLNSSVNAK